jgi:hypothetical protein
MKGWKRTLILIGFAITGVLFLFAALEERVIDGGPIHYTWLGIAMPYFALAVVFFARGRRFGGGDGPPNA